MPERMVYPFKHHTKVQEAFFKDLCTWESGKSQVDDLYMWYCRGLLSFTDYTYHLYEHVVTPSAVPRFKKLRRADETTLYFLPCYHFRLLLDFVSNTEKTGYEWDRSFTAWEKILLDFWMSAMERYADCYNKELYSKKFYEIRYIWRCDYKTIFDYELPGSLAELFRAAEGVLVSGLMEKLSAKDNEKERSFFSRDFPEVCRKIHPYYAELDEIARDIFFEEDRS